MPTETLILDHHQILWRGRGGGDKMATGATALGTMTSDNWPQRPTHLVAYGTAETTTCGSDRFIVVLHFHSYSALALVFVDMHVTLWEGYADPFFVKALLDAFV